MRQVLEARADPASGRHWVPTSSMRSISRLEKPHSLSYQPSTLTVLPFDHRVDRREDARRRVPDDVGRHQRLVAVLEDAAVAGVVGGFGERGVDVVDRRFLVDVGDQVGDRPGRRRHPQGHAVEAALEVGQHQADRLGGAGRVGHDRQRGGPHPPEVGLPRPRRGGQVLELLVARVRVHGGDQVRARCRTRSLSTFASGARQFVVHEAFEITVCAAGSNTSSLTRCRWWRRRRRSERR